MKLMIYSLVVLFTPFLYAQPTIEWQFRYGGTGSDQLSSVIQTVDGGYIAIGQSWSNDGDVTFNHGNNEKYDVWVVKLNEQGIMEWEKSYGGTNWDYGTEILQTPDGGYVFVGTTRSIDGDIGSPVNNYTVWVVKLNPTGDIEWENTFGFQTFGKSIFALENGSFVIAANKLSSYWIFQIDPTGETIIWEEEYGGSQQESLGTMVRTNTNGCIMTGSSWSDDGDVTGHHGSDSFGDYWVVNVDSLGQLIWEKSLGGTLLEQSQEIIATSDGGSLVTGVTFSNNGDVEGLHDIGGDTNDAWIVKLNEAGDIDWQKCLGGTMNDQINTMFETTEGNFIVAGMTVSQDGDVDIDQLHGGGDCWIVTMSPQGNIISQTIMGGSLFDLIVSIIPCNDGGMLFGGTSKSSDGDVSSTPLSFYEDFWVVKLGAVSSVEEPGSQAVPIYPNPGNTILHIESTETDPLAQISITNLSGSLIYKQDCTLGEFIDLSLLSAGVYLVTTETKSGKKRVSKWVKQ